MKRKFTLIILSLFLFQGMVLAQKPQLVKEELAAKKAKALLTDFADNMNVIGDSTHSPKAIHKAKLALKDLFYKVKVVVKNDLTQFSEDAANDSAYIPMYQYLKYWEEAPVKKEISFDFNKFRADGIYINADRNAYQIKAKVLKKLVWSSDSMNSDSVVTSLEETQESIQDFYIYVEEMYGEFNKFQIEAINDYKEEPFFLPLSELDEFWVSLDSSWKKVFINRFNLKPVPTAYRLNFIKGVDELDFGGETISSLEPFKRLTGLKKLKMNNTGLTDLDFLKNCKKLIELDVSENKIESLEGVKELTSLEVLDASDNQITNVGPLKSMQNLKELYLGNNIIDSVDALIGLVNMEKLSLASNNELHDVTSLRNMKYLRELDISKNKDIKNIAFISNKFEMVKLDIFNTSVPSLDPIKNLRRIAYLDCGYTKITSLDPIKNHVYLYFLNISGNKIDDFSALSNFSNIQYFYCNTTSISDISPIIRMEGIREFKAIHTNFTKADIQRFKKEHPRCEITYY